MAVKTTQAYALSMDAYFKEHPLSDEEQSSGRALRLVRCLRSAAGRYEDGPQSFLWLVLSCKRTGRAPRPHAMAFVDENGKLQRIAALRGRRLSTRRVCNVDSSENPWTIDEYVFESNMKAGRLVLLAGKSHLIVGRTRLRQEQESYGQAIANASVDARYPEWLEHQRSLVQAQAQAQTQAPLEDGPLFSLITPAYRTPDHFLREMLQSVMAQSYRRWELVVINASPDDVAMRRILRSIADPRVRVVESPENLGIVGNTNKGIEHARGDYLCFLDHDDTLEPHALAAYAQAIRDSHNQAGLLYCDEDNIDEHNHPCLPLLKPDFNYDLLLNNDYMLHMLTARRDIIMATQRSEAAVEGAQDYDLILRALEAGATVVHIPQILYHWRIHQQSSAAGAQAKPYAQKAAAHAIQEHLRRSSQPARVDLGRAAFTYIVDYQLPQHKPCIYVLCKDKLSDITAAALQQYEDEFQTSVFLCDQEEPSVSSIWACIEKADSSALIMLTSAEIALDFDNLCRLVAHACRPTIMGVSPRVIRDDGLFDFAGMLIRPDGSLMRLLELLPQADGGYVGRSERPYDSCALDDEVALVNVEALRRLGLDEHFQTVQYALVDASVRGRAEGLTSLYMPYATARLCCARTMLAPEVQAESLQDAAELVAKHPMLKQCDMSHNPWFDPWSPYYQLRWDEFCPSIEASQDASLEASQEA